MVHLQAVRVNNARLKDYGSNLVGVFVGGTSGIGEATARAFASNTLASRIYLIGRNEAQASKIIEELRQVNPDGQVNFIKCDASRLRNVDEACRTIQEKEEKVNLLFLSSGILTTKGRDETEEGLDMKLSLHYYSRMRFINDLLPLLTRAGNDTDNLSPPQPGLRRNLSSVVSVLHGGAEGPLILDDLSLKTHFSMSNCARHAITMTSLSMQELAFSHPETSFVHAFPGIVKTGATRDFGIVTRTVINAVSFLARPWMVPLNESGDRHLYAATSPRFIPRASKDIGDTAPGVDGSIGSGAYLLHWDGSTAGDQKVLQDFCQNETGKSVWEHTMSIFESICGKRST
ncbi:hypothetical protein N7519_006589 [Penicillium mononematosum]|uniref:uncharacterized protein n=1 Tax=Penicillium mononematosum TaxID=268346 RepID=UPI0025498575|nr:uncharacterized protein N7519_006589 [Penicillium mononematosum]KAJ6185288.1 hypothetical protein N7519_006589 [Penicillium mononematosum]